ncbi:nucleotide-binding universal stress UspA family protein [Kordia periserrulae]|uniref:Nucleotide-binding universal stress UspA family protein n=1 Tax=Kordia periserrulae TaxID=701523 RepID=A0A2T6C1T2_9FLAO|nr:universal stress protein [Kordia periserrulae]PTX62282.1 nucleotide-binding universal stress UspA family protein [Kordia periserrulae]
MKKILLPTDFSENSLNAIRYAVQLYKDQKCNFILLNTYTPVIYHVQYMEVGAAQFGLLDALKEKSQNGLKSVQETIEKEFPNPKHFFSRISAFNMLISEIEQLYEENTMDMIIMGTQGASGLQEVLFGSNMVHVLKNSKCPLLAVPSDYSYQHPHEILFPSDYGVNFEERHVEDLKQIASLFAARVNILHVSNADELSPSQEANKQKLTTLLKGTSHLFHIVQHHDVGTAIQEFQSQSRIDFLTMLNNKHSFFENLFFGSKVKHIGLHLNTPFLIIPAKI